MTESGSDSHESDPDLSCAEIEALRRRLYSRAGASTDAVAQYAAVAGAADHDQSVTITSSESPFKPSTPRSIARSRRRRVLWIGASCVALVTFMLIGLWWRGSHTNLPERLGPPAAAGSTLLYYSRAENPESAPDKVTFEPADERMVFRADGHRLTIALRCIGRGQVRITVAEHPYEFRCTDTQRTLSRRTAHPMRGPFFIFGRTTGDVVWGLRVASLATSVPSEP